MHYFVSAGEPSGDIHGHNLIKALRQKDPTARFSGFGGDQMRSVGCHLLYPLCNLSVMWFLRVFLNIITFLRLRSQATEFFQREKPDAVILIDFPGFHWHLAYRAKREGIPVFYFVPPQLWAWGAWRVQKMKDSVDCVLSALPFEHEWYLQNGVRSEFIGHPFYDNLEQKILDQDFLSRQKERPGRIVAILPGSRTQEVTRNFSDILDAACRVYREVPNTRFLVASYNDTQAEVARKKIIGRDLPIDVQVGRTSEIIESAECCIMVSGSVSLEVMYHLKPAVVVYRLSRIALRVGKAFMKVKYITLVNLLARKEIFPEFLTDHNAAIEISSIVTDWLTKPSSENSVTTQLAALKSEIAQSGACDRAANCIIGTLRENRIPETIIKNAA
ncbi:lipid-A-disaccharide synthase [Telmatocola sphagniphila]|uniref:Lipid-A-disaccharide synthase n=1 Tax=Telmatocola sphagniphila TaxID=1123043 RepID=A0A8E6B8K0_9BACT|nr:lipid-A-disaccharide synthase [Telmatocola sphagniphila]QVL33347.1 lipid-A-disaccharide synthase [Telmatocola sphagniphila]